MFYKIIHERYKNKINKIKGLTISKTPYFASSNHWLNILEIRKHLSKKKLSKDNELHNAFYLADRLKKTINEVMNMTMDEFQHWMAYFKLEERKQKQQYGKK